jgi:hypothetical protein
MWNCVICYAEIAGEQQEDEYGNPVGPVTPASRYWNADMSKVYCGPEHAMLDLRSIVCDNPHSALTSTAKETL